MASTLASATMLAGRLIGAHGECFHRRRVQWLSSVCRMFFSTSHNSGGRIKRRPPRNWFYLVSLLVVGASGGFLYRRVTERRRTHIYTLAEALQETRTIITNLKKETGCPGVTVAVSKDGRIVLCEGIGYADVENAVPCTADSVMKIASISKPITTTILARLWERRSIDIDAPIGCHVKTWPQKKWGGNEVSVTVRQLASHLAGVRDYRRMKQNDKSSGKLDTTDGHNEFGFEEYYIKDDYESVTAALELFKDDPLVSKPGSEFHYTTHGFTLISAALEGASGHTFPSMVQELFAEIGMTASGLDDKQRLLYHRARGYTMDDNGVLRNAPYTSSSFKWAGAGLVSTVKDLVRFGNMMLYSFQSKECSDADLTPGYLKPETVQQLWTPVTGTAVSWDKVGRYGMGWQIVPISDARFCVGHTGGTIGASCALMLLPPARESTKEPPQGVVVAILTNLQAANLGPIAVRIAKIIDEVDALNVEGHW